MTAWSYCAMAPLNDGSGAESMKCSQLSKKFVDNIYIYIPFKHEVIYLCHLREFF